MKIPFKFKFRPNWTMVAYAALASGVVHILATLLPAYVSGNTAFARLSDGLPINEFVVLPPARPGTQVIPYQLPDARYAICRFDARGGPVSLTATLPAEGWTLSIYTSDGTSFYDAPGRADGSTKLNLMLVPPGGYFLGVPEDTQAAASEHSEIASPATSGLVVIRAPLGGAAYAHETERVAKMARCAAKPFAG